MLCILISPILACTPLIGDPEWEMGGSVDFITQVARDLSASIGDDVNFIAEVAIAPGICSQSNNNCEIWLDHKGNKLSITYYDPERSGPCSMTETLDIVSEMSRGDKVEVFGRFHGRQSISICGSSDYYIRQLPTDK